MATAKNVPAVTRTEVIEVEPAKVVLTLDEPEARVLAAILSKVGGSPKGYRGKADSVSVALRKAGYDWSTGDRYSNRSVEHKAIEGSLHFNDVDTF